MNWMNTAELDSFIDRLRADVGECDWVEFKTNNSDPEEIGQYISALSNAAALAEQESAFAVLTESAERPRFR